MDTLSRKQLEAELKNVYHNATLSGSLVTESDYEQDLYNRELDIYIEQAFESIAHDLPEFCQLFGECYQWGRGGRTVAPSSLVTRRGGGSFSIVSIEDLEDRLGELNQHTLELLKDFNKYVREWCSDTPDHVLNTIREEYREELLKNKNKKRITKMVTSYE